MDVYKQYTFYYIKNQTMFIITNMQVNIYIFK